MSFESFDRGATKVVAQCDTASGAVLGQGVLSASPVRVGQMRLTLQEQIGANEFIAWSQLVSGDSAVSSRVTRVSDSEVDVETLDAGGAPIAGVAWVFVALVRPFNAVASSAPIPGVFDLVVNNATGDDANPGTEAEPLATLPEALVRATAGGIVRQTTRILLQQTGIDYVMVPVPPALLVSPLLISVDETFGVPYSQVLTQAAQAGTTADEVVGAGLVPAAHVGQSIRFLDGAAVGQRKTIVNNDGATIELSTPFLNGAPVPGDSFEIFTPNVEVDMSIFSGRQSLGGLQGPIGIAGSGLTAVPLALVGLNLTGGSWSPGAHSLAIYGCASPVAAGNEIGCGLGSLLIGADGAVEGAASSDLPLFLGAGADDWLGWGYDAQQPAAVRVNGGHSLIAGCAFVAARFADSFLHFAGGVMYTTDGSIPLTIVRGLKHHVLNGVSSATPPRVVALGAASFAMNLSEGAIEILDNGLRVDSAQGGVTMGRRAFAQISGPGLVGTKAAGAAPALNCVDGSFAALRGAPVYGDGAANDYFVGNGSPQNKSFFAAPGTAMSFFAGANANGATIERVS